MSTQSINMRTHDLGLAAALVSSGFELRATSRDRNGRFYFAFRQDLELERTVNSYWADSLNVKARKFFDNTKMLKSRIYADE